MREEFSKPDQVIIIKRATREDGVIVCEQCGCQCKRFEIDHIIAEGLRVDRSKKLTAKDGQLLCAGTPESCHDIKSNKSDKPAIAQAKRREAADLGARTNKQKIPHRPKPEKTRRDPARGMPEIARRWGIGS